MASIKLAYQPSASSSHIVVENLGPQAGTPAQDRYTIWAVIDRRKGVARPVGSARCGSNDLEEASRHCREIEANMSAASEAGQRY